MSEGFSSFREFYPFYLGEHRNRTCRRLHFTGTSLAIGFIVLAIKSGNPWWLLAALGSGYAFAWIGQRLCLSRAHWPGVPELDASTYVLPQLDDPSTYQHRAGKL